MNPSSKLRSSLLQHTMVRWWLAGLSFIGIGIGILYVFVDVLKLPLALGSIIGAELGTLLRFLVNDRWVFGHRFPTWTRLWQYHVANASSFVIWWGVTNVLPHWGVHYLLATVAGMAASAGWSMVTNFLWIWRRKPPPPPVRVPSS